MWHNVFINFFYIILAGLGLSFLVFIHELGHYLVARHVKMRVEVFSIGFGKPIYSWVRKGVKWQICYILFGGYVKIAGTEKEGNLEPYQIKDGFFGKKPKERIKVAIMGPLVNIVFALFAFSLIWALGGREKTFTDYTKLVGYVDPQSQLYDYGVHPGDEIIKYNGEDFEGSKSLIRAAVLNGRPACVQGYKINYPSLEKSPFQYTVKPYDNPNWNKGLKTVGILSPASYLIYQPYDTQDSETLPEGLPMSGSGIQTGDRIVWANGQYIFSNLQLSHILNDQKAFLTLQREGKILHVQVPKVLISNLRISSEELGELEDWAFAHGIKDKVKNLYFIPYQISVGGIVEAPYPFINEQSEEDLMDENKGEFFLKKGDQILAVGGNPIASGYELLNYLQKNYVQIIVQNEGQTKSEKISWKHEDRIFEEKTEWMNILHIANTIGTQNLVKEQGNCRVLHPIEPVKLKNLSKGASPAITAMLNQINKNLEQAKEIKNPNQRAQAIEYLTQVQNRYALGIHLHDQVVVYNPNPFHLFGDVFQEIWNTFSALITGALKPKWIAGPIGIVQIMQHSWMGGFKEALFWLGAISLNLGIFNLLPVPVLDGGHITLSVIEAIRKKPMSAKTMQRIMIPFIFLLIGMFIFVTFNDLSRIFSNFF